MDCCAKIIFFNKAEGDVWSGESEKPEAGTRGRVNNQFFCKSVLYASRDGQMMQRVV